MKRQPAQRSSVVPDLARPLERKGILVEGGTASATVADLQRRCAGALEKLLSDLADWNPAEQGKSWLVSDSRYLIVSFKHDRATEVYIQFLSVPTEETIVMEAVSPQYEPALKKLLTPKRVEALRARGFSLGKRPSNFRREFPRGGRRAARTIANEAVAVLFEAFRYRGVQPLSFKLHTNRRAVSRFVHFGLTRSQVALLVDSWGFVSEQGDPDNPDEPIVHVRQSPSGDAVLHLHLSKPVGKSGRFQVVVLACRFVPHPGVTLELLNEWNTNRRMTRAFRDPDGSIWFETYVDLRQGATEENLRHSVETFPQDIQDFVLGVSKTVPEPGPTSGAVN